MINISIPSSLFMRFKDLHGESLAKEYFEVYEASHQALFEEVKKQSTQKKLELRDELSKELASKADIVLLKADLALLKADIRAEMAELRTEIAQSKNNFIKWLFGIIVGATVAIIGTMLSVIKMGGG